MRRGMFALLCSLSCSVANGDNVQEEKDRMDIYHKIMEVARRGQLHSAPIYVNPHDPPRILDLGCGTGIWAIDMAE
jgi:ubiquinone/menaquinone biosynthesis C-methylase UbiE